MNGPALGASWVPSFLLFTAPLRRNNMSTIINLIYENQKPTRAHEGLPVFYSPLNYLHFFRVSSLDLVMFTK